MAIESNDDKESFRTSIEEEWSMRLSSKLFYSIRTNRDSTGYTSDEKYLVRGSYYQFMTGLAVSVASPFVSLIMFRRLRSHGRHFITWKRSFSNWMTDTVMSVVVGYGVYRFSTWSFRSATRSRLRILPSEQSTSDFAETHCPDVLAEYEKITKEIEAMDEDVFLTKKKALMMESYQNPSNPALQAMFAFCSNCEKRLARNERL